MNDDRVSEVYRGELSTERSQRICRDRIHWMCAQARGRVLDIGSSQGITSILLARAGHDVVGVEVEAPAIAFARAELARESAEVRQRLRFVHADVHDDVLAGQTFDTVVLGEILEHHDAPRALWLRAAQLVAPGGRLIGTTPFGLFPHHDHKVTFYFRSFLDTIAGVGAITHLDVHDRYLRFVVDTAPGAVAVDLGAEALLARSEQAFLAIQLEVEAARRERKQGLARATHELGEEIATLTRSLDAARVQLGREQERAAASRADAERARAELDALRPRLRAAERVTVPPAGASPAVRGLGALLGSIQRELNGGGLRAAPVQALRKTYGRVRRALRGE